MSLSVRAEVDMILSDLVAATGGEQKMRAATGEWPLCQGGPVLSPKQMPLPVPQASSNPQLMLSLQPTLPQSLHSALFSPSLP